MSEKKIHLAKGGQSYGPFSSLEIEALKRSGELKSYSHRWDPMFRRWTMLEELPSPPAVERSTAHVSGIQAVCHDRIHLVNGVLESITDHGCELVTQDLSHRPYFAPDARVILNVLDAESGRSANLMGRLRGARHSNLGWRYEILWDKKPEVLAVL